MQVENYIKRLSIIKLLFKNGIEQSFKNEVSAGFSILQFHDSVEMFLKLSAQKLNKNKKENSFMSYWELIPDLSLKEQMRTLNNIRNNLKHDGLMPAKIEIESARVLTTSFLEENVPKIFDVEFSEVSLTILIENEAVRTNLLKAEQELRSANNQLVVKNVAQAFHELIESYQKSSPIYHSSKLWSSMLKRVDFKNDAWTTEKRTPIDRNLKEVFKVVDENFKKLSNAQFIISLGLEYTNYLKFQSLSPTFYKTENGDYVFTSDFGEMITKEDCDFMISFVIDSCLILQSFTSKKID